jgi:tetratricopeptide (TPR) repeat protein
MILKNTRLLDIHMQVKQKAVKHYDQGIILHDKGKLANAERAYKKAIKINPNFVEAHSNLGSVLLDQGRLKEASNAYLKALKLAPNHPMLLNNVGNVLQLQGENEKALSWFDKAIKQDPDNVDAYRNLGNALRALDRNEEAFAAYKRAVEINPELADTYYNLGLILLELDELDEAINCFNQALRINPADKSAYLGLGSARSAQGNLDQAVAAYQKAIAIDPANEKAYLGLGNARSAQGNLDQAVVAYQKAIAIDPVNTEFYRKLGDAFSDHGEIAEAVSTYRKALEINPEYAKAHYSLSKNKKFTEYDDDISAMESLLSTKGISDEDSFQLAFGLGKAYEDLGNFDKSMEFVIKATQLKRNSYDYSTSESQEVFDRFKEVFSPDFFSTRVDSGDPDRTPIFILGMPRSGTSLVEQILASHPDVYGAGELKDLGNVFESIRTSDKEKQPAIIPGELLELDAKAFADLGEQYIARIRKYSANAKFITDKMPGNFLRIGFIRTILPNARIIHCTRNPMDNCLSIFKNYLLNGHGYADNMSELGQYYRMYLELMDYWRATLPGFVYDQSYEELVRSQQEQVSKLLQHCGLDWNDACLDFHKTRRKVKTSSNAQVHRPIYTDSVQMWTRYEEQLEPLKAAIYG